MLFAAGVLQPQAARNYIMLLWTLSRSILVGPSPSVSTLASNPPEDPEATDSLDRTIGTEVGFARGARILEEARTKEHCGIPVDGLLVAHSPLQSDLGNGTSTALRSRPTSGLPYSSSSPQYSNLYSFYISILPEYIGQ